MNKIYYEEQPMLFRDIDVGEYFRIRGILFLKLNEYQAVPDDYIISISQYEEVEEDE